MKRSAPLVRRAPLKNRAPMPRSSAKIRPNAARKARLFVRNYHSDEYRDWLVGHACVIPGCTNRDVIAAHARSKGAGGDWRDLFPCCNAHHDEQHALGVRTWRVKYAVEPDIIARVLAARWESLTADLPASEPGQGSDPDPQHEGDAASGPTSGAESGRH